MQGSTMHILKRCRSIAAHVEFPLFSARPWQFACLERTMLIFATGRSMIQGHPLKEILIQGPKSILTTFQGSVLSFVAKRQKQVGVSSISIKASSNESLISVEERYSPLVSISERIALFHTEHGNIPPRFRVYSEDQALLPTHK